MAGQLRELVSCWMAWGGIDESLAPKPECIEAGFGAVSEPCRSGADPRLVAGWEHRHGFRLPSGLRAWLMLSNGLYREGPLIHPISAIGPMIVFSRIHDLVIQPESWFELGNPNVETICIDLAYRWPGGGNPVFTSGDDSTGSAPRIIARSFEEWFLELPPPRRPGILVRPGLRRPRRPVAGPSPLHPPARPPRPAPALRRTAGAVHKVPGGRARDRPGTAARTRRRGVALPLLAACCSGITPRRSIEGRSSTPRRAEGGE